MKQTFYAIRIGGKLYLQSKQFFTSQKTTTNVFDAMLFDSYSSAQKALKSVFGGEIIELTLTDRHDDESELDMLRASVKQLQIERDEAIKELKKIRGEHYGTK